MKTEVDELDIGELETTPVDLSKLSNVVKNDIVKKTEFNELVNKVNAIQTTDTSNLVKKTDYKTKINEMEKETIDHGHAKYITTQKFLAPDHFTGRLKQANLASKNDIPDFLKKTDFDGKLKNLNKKVISNKTKHELSEIELNELSKKFKLLSAKDYNFFLSRIYFTSNHGSQNTFLYQLRFDTLELRKD